MQGCSVNGECKKILQGIVIQEKMKMNKKFLLLGALFAMLFVFSLNGCDCNGTTPPPNPTPSGTITLSRRTASLDIDETLKLTYVFEDMSAMATWTSSNSNVASVSSDGTVKALAVGVTSIRVTIGSSYAECSVNVYDSYPYPVLLLELSEARILVGETFEIEAWVVYRGTAVVADITYLSDDTVVAAVDENGVVEGKSVGVAQITVEATYDSKLLQQYFDIAVLTADILD